MRVREMLKLRDQEELNFVAQTLSSIKGKSTILWCCVWWRVSVPIFTYSVEVVRQQSRFTSNSLFRIIFNNRWSESVSALQSFLNRPTWEQQFPKSSLQSQSYDASIQISMSVRYDFFLIPSDYCITAPAQSSATVLPWIRPCWFTD